jgi:integrase
MPKSKSENGAGSIYQRADGRWEACLWVTTTSGNRKRLRTYGRTQGEARMKLTAMHEHQRKALPVPDSTWRLDDYLDRWLTVTGPQKYRPSTLSRHRDIAQRHIKPYLGHYRLDALTVQNVQEAINAFLRDGHSPDAAKHLRMTLSAALSRALREELIHRNVAHLVELPHIQRRTVVPWTAEEARRFIRTATGHRWEVAFLLIALYGARRGEALGLRWRDVDLDAGTIEIIQQVQLIDGQFVIGPVKTAAGNRTLPITPALRTAILRLAAEQRLPQRPDGLPDTTAAGDQLITATQHGGPVMPRNFRRTFQDLIDKAGVPTITIHHVRHTVATLLKDLGVPARDTQAILGHANISTTQQIYQHTSLEASQTALEAVTSALGAERDSDSDKSENGGPDTPTPDHPGAGSRQLTATGKATPQTDGNANKENRRRPRPVEWWSFSTPCGSAWV